MLFTREAVRLAGGDAVFRPGGSGKGNEMFNGVANAATTGTGLMIDASVGGALIGRGGGKTVGSPGKLIISSDVSRTKTP